MEEEALETEDRKKEYRVITGEAMVCGVIGNPVGHSLSPLMHNYFAEALKLDYIYVPCKVQEEEVGAAVKGIHALGFQGINVTVPHKQRVMEHLVELDDAARCIGAVNTLVRTESGYKGYNTDAEGLYRAISGQGIDVRGRDCLMIGAGGAAKAVAYMLMSHGAASVVILNRTVEKAQALADEMNRQFGCRTMRALSLADWTKLNKDSYLALQTTSVGMHPKVDAAPIEDRDFYKKIRMAVDIIYTPARTRFMEYVEEAGGKAINGLDMLIYQGVIAFELWNPDVHVTDEVVEAVRRKMMDRLAGRNTEK